MIWTALSSLISSSQGFAIYDVSTSSSFPIYEGKIANADITNGSPLDLGKEMGQGVGRLDHLWNLGTLFLTPSTKFWIVYFLSQLQTLIIPQQARYFIDWIAMMT
jgi:hypothetical protein